MARHRQPRELAALKGADKRNPQRYKKQTPEAEFPLGDVPARLGAEEKAAWFELETFALKGVLTGADRLVLELTARLVAQMRSESREFPAAKMGHLIGCLARLGLTPADRQKLGTEKPSEGNPFNEF